MKRICPSFPLRAVLTGDRRVSKMDDKLYPGLLAEEAGDKQLGETDGWSEDRKAHGEKQQERS